MKPAPTPPAADLARLRAKLSGRKPLTPEERRLLARTLEEQEPAPQADPADAPEFVRGQAALAVALGASRSSVHRWLRETGNPGRRPDGRYSLPEWRAWLQSRGSIVGAGQEALSLREQLVAAQIRKLDHALEVAKGRYFEKEQVRAWCGELATAVRQVVCTLHLKAADLAGLGVPELELRLRDFEDEILRQLHALGKRTGQPLQDSSQTPAR